MEWLFDGIGSELKAYLKELAQDSAQMHNRTQAHRMVQLARKTSPLMAARIKWLLVRILRKPKI